MPWTPPDPPDPRAILREAEADTRSGAHADALAKFLWFHHNALRCDPALVGVRLSFALSSWMRLAEAYPPARDALLRTREEAEAAFAADPSGFDRFQELAALNGYLGNGLRTADAFAAAARRDRASAGRLYQVAEPHLIEAGRYEECGPFLEPRTRLWLARETHRVMSDFEEEMPEENPPPKLARTLYVRDVATLVALLVLHRRPDEARRARDEALTVADDADSRAVLDAAMSGHLPPDPG